MRPLLVGAACGVLACFALAFLTVRATEAMVDRATRTRFLES